MSKAELYTFICPHCKGDALKVIVDSNEKQKFKFRCDNCAFPILENPDLTFIGRNRKQSITHAYWFLLGYITKSKSSQGIILDIQKFVEVHRKIEYSAVKIELAALFG
jgi:Zn finger protein HypA/HybF involved in hydrogenase expression